MIKKYLSTLEDSTKELDFVRQQQDILDFSKLQYLGYTLHSILAPTQLTEVRLIGQIKGEYNDEGLYPGAYFDAKTATVDYTGFNDIYDQYCDEAQIYEERIRRYNKDENSPFLALDTLNTKFSEFLYQFPDLESIVDKLTDKPFTKELDSIMKTLYSKEDFKAWKIMRETDNLENSVPSATEATSKPARKRKI